MDIWLISADNVLVILLESGDGSQNDFVGSTTSAQEAEGVASLVLCEGCGLIQVDSNGFCTSSDCDKGGHNETS